MTKGLKVFSFTDLVVSTISITDVIYDIIWGAYNIANLPINVHSVQNVIHGYDGVKYEIVRMPIQEKWALVIQYGMWKRSLR